MELEAGEMSNSVPYIYISKALHLLFKTSVDNFRNLKTLSTKKLKYIPRLKSHKPNAHMGFYSEALCDGPSLFLTTGHPLPIP